MKQIDNQNITNANATTDNAYKINTNKCIEHNPSKPKATSMREKGTNKYENAHIQAVTIEFSSKRESEPSVSRMFVKLFPLDYKSAK